MFFSALGRAQKASVITPGRQVFFCVPLVFLLPCLSGEVGLWIAYPLGDFLVTIIALFLISGELKRLKLAPDVSEMVPVFIRLSTA